MFRSKKTIPFLVPLIFLSQNEHCSLSPLLGRVNDTFKVLPSYFLTLLHEYAGSKAVSIHVLQRQGSSLSLNRRKRKDNKIRFCFVTVNLLYHGIMRGWICMGIYFNRVEFESGYRVVGGSADFQLMSPFMQDRCTNWAVKQHRMTLHKPSFTLTPRS